MKNFPLSSDPKIIIVPVRIVGPAAERYVRVILDTGATYTMICPEILDEVGYDLSKPLRDIEITTASQVEKASFYVLSHLNVLGNDLKNIEVASHQLPKKVPAEGLLGLNVLKNFDVHVEFLQRILRFSN